ncbi:MAG: response regulator transcription factor [Rubrobacteraceae bacterium]
MVGSLRSHYMMVFVLASTPMARAGLRAMLYEAGIESSESMEAEVILASGEDLIEAAEEILPGDGMQSLLVLAEDDNLITTLRQLQLRAWGIVEPDAPPEELAAAVAAVGEGLVVLPRNLTERVLQSPRLVEDLDEPLTPREGEVLELLGRGLSNKLIAGELHISEHTVKFHISSLYAKLGVSSRAEAVSQGARYGLISL